MKYLSVCSGIEAASVAWEPLGWKPLAFSEIEPFPCALLAEKYPSVPNLGDMTKFQEWPDLEPDILVGGTPCQSFSVAGLRKGLADPRGNLTLTYLAIAARYRPEWLVWENVPGVLSDKTGAFASLLGGLAELGYGWAYRILDAQYVRVESHPRAVPQRRRRVFVVGHLGDWRRAAAVLFEREGLCGHPPPRREAGERPAARSGCGFEVGGALGPRVSRLTTDECAQGAAIVAHSLKAEGFDASEDGTGRGVPLVCGALSDGAHMGGGSTARTPTAGGSSPLPPVAWALQERDAKGADSSTKPGHLIPVGGGFDDAIPFDTTQITSAGNYSRPQPGDPAHPLAAHAHAPAIAFSCKDHGADAGEVAPTLRSMEFDGSHANGGGQVAVAFHNRQDPDVSGDVTHPLGAKDSGLGVGISAPSLTASNDPSRSPQSSEVTQQVAAVHGATMQVRRLTPRECERLQGFPDDYTLVQVRGKPAADGPRYRALGNSMAVNVMRWIGGRIKEVA